MLRLPESFHGASGIALVRHIEGKGQHLRRQLAALLRVTVSALLILQAGAGGGQPEETCHGHKDQPSWGVRLEASKCDSLAAQRDRRAAACCASAALTSKESRRPLGFLAQAISIVARTLAALLKLSELSMVLQYAEKLSSASCSCFALRE